MTSSIHQFLIKADHWRKSLYKIRMNAQEECPNSPDPSLWEAHCFAASPSELHFMTIFLAKFSAMDAKHFAKLVTNKGREK